MNAGVFVLCGFRRRDEHHWTMGSVEDLSLVDCSWHSAALPSGPVSESLPAVQKARARVGPLLREWSPLGAPRSGAD